ncbi:MAG: hypothetical protein WCK67_06545 [bacterium]
MKLKEAVDLIWDNRRYDTASETEAISHLNEEVAECLKALLRGDKDKAQVELEDALSCMLIALKVLKMDPEQIVWRQINRMKTQPHRVMHIYSNRVEIKVGDEIKGGWAIWSLDDLKDAKKMAKEFKCKISIEEENPFLKNETVLELESVLQDGEESLNERIKA